MSPARVPLIEWLGSASGDAATLGGKAASLDRLARMGFRIPPGFCLTTEAFRRQLSELGVGEVAADSDEGTIAARLAAHRLADDLAHELRVALERLCAEAPIASQLALAGVGAGAPGAGAAGAGAATAEEDRRVEPTFAVRSSAIGEDGSAASYAGLHETELGVTPDGVDASVRRCWASLWSPEALAYRRFRGFTLHGEAMAVVVQSLVPADSAAVAFTRHPVTGREDQMVVTAVRGLGDAMVSGTVTPDTYVIDKASLETVDFEPGDGERALDETLLRELAELCLRVEAGFRRAVDIEAAVVGDTWYLLQARPITTR